MTLGQVENGAISGAEPRRESVLEARGISPYVCYVLLLCVLVFFGLVRYRLRGIPLERDEGEFAYGGQLILQGSPLYKGVYTLKLPGTYAAYAVMFRILGESASRIHIGLIFVNAATSLLVFLVCARMFGRLAGLVAGASYALLSTSPSVVGFAAHATHFVLLFAMAGVWLLLESLDRNKRWILFGSGLAFGMAFLMKQPAVFFLIWAALYLLWLSRRRAAAWGGLVGQWVALSLGFALPFLATCFLTWRSGSFQDFWFWTFLYANRYGANADLKYGMGWLRENGAHVIAPALGLWLMAALGLTAFLWDRPARPHGFFTASFLVFSFLAVCPGLYFREHYFILMLAAVAMLVGVAVSCWAEILRQLTGSRLVAALPLLLFVLAFASGIYCQRDYFFHLTPLQAAKQVYGLNPFPEAQQVSDYIAKNTPKDATIVVLGCEPEIYFYSHRHAATGHGCAYPLLEPKYGINLQRQMEYEIQQARPDMIVLINDPASWVAFPNVASPDEIMGWTNEYMRKYYVLDGIAEMDEYGTNYYWGNRARNHPVMGQRNILILKRKSY